MSHTWGIDWHHKMDVFLYTIASTIDTSGLPRPNTDNTIDTALNLVFAIAASIAALMVVIGGFRYILAHGDSNAVAQARKTVLYAIIGLVVIMVAFSIVTFVIRGVD